MYEKLKKITLHYTGTTPLTIATLCLICVVFTLIMVHAMLQLARL